LHSWQNIVLYASAATYIYLYILGLIIEQHNSSRTRARTLSTVSTHTPPPRCSTPSCLNPCARPTLNKTATGSGSFTLTRSAAASLQQLDTSSRHIRHSTFSGVFPPSSSRTPSTLSRRSSRSDFTNDGTDTTPGTPDSLPSPVPSISRTASEFEPFPETYRLPPQKYPIRESAPPRMRQMSHNRESYHGAQEMNPILAELERKSKLLRAKTACSTCGALGTDYPKCPRCGDMWCSRQCRIGVGKKHICSRASN
jgi:hypothetical protein